MFYYIWWHSWNSATIFRYLQDCLDYKIRPPNYSLTSICYRQRFAWTMRLGWLYWFQYTVYTGRIGTEFYSLEVCRWNYSFNCGFQGTAKTRNSCWLRKSVPIHPAYLESPRLTVSRSSKLKYRTAFGTLWRPLESGDKPLDFGGLG